MPLFSDKGAASKGERVPLRYKDGLPVCDPENGKPVALFLRTLTDDVIQDIEKDYPLKRRWVQTPRGKIPEQYRPKKAEMEVWKRKLCYVFSDTENMIVQIDSQDALDFYRNELGDTSLELGAAVCLDGRLTNAIRLRVLDVVDRALYNFIVWWMGEKATRYHQEEEEAEENL